MVRHLLKKDHQTFKNSAMLQSMIGQWRYYTFRNSITRCGTAPAHRDARQYHQSSINHRSSVSESTVTQLLSTYAPENQWKSINFPRFPRLPQLRLVALIAPGNERAILLRGERVGETFTDGGRRIQARAWPTHHIPKIGAVRREKEIRKYPSRIIFE